MVGLGWDARTTTGDKFDLDASALGCGENGKVLSNDYFIFFNQTRSPEGAIEHRGDNRDRRGRRRRRGDRDRPGRGPAQRSTRSSS